MKGLYLCFNTHRSQSVSDTKILPTFITFSWDVKISLLVDLKPGVWIISKCFFCCRKKVVWTWQATCTGYLLQEQAVLSSTARTLFTARCYASAVLAMGLCPSVSVCLSITSRCSTKTAKRRITQTTPHDTPGTLDFWSQRSPRNSTGVTPYEGTECSWGGQNRRLSTNNRLYLENGTR